MNPSIHVYIYIQTGVYINIYVNIYIYIYVYTCAYIWKHMYLDVYIYIYIYADARGGRPGVQTYRVGPTMLEQHAESNETFRCERHNVLWPLFNYSLVDSHLTVYQIGDKYHAFYTYLVMAALRLIGRLNIWSWCPEGVLGSSLHPLGSSLAPPGSAWGCWGGGANISSTFVKMTVSTFR